MGSSYTLGDIRDKIETDLDLKEETMISETELNANINEAIREAEAEVHSLNEDYFLTTFPLPVTQGTSLYSLPTDIYATKIRAIIWNNGTEVYRINKLINKSYQFEEITLTNTFSTSLRYRYILLNSLTSGQQISFTPPMRDTLSSAVTIYYIRDARQLVDDDDVLDIPEGYNFILAYAKAKCLAKENMGQIPPGIAAEVEHQRQLMRDLLCEKIPDDDNEIEQDLSHYEEAT